MCPSFTHPAWDTADGPEIRVWVDFDNPEHRESEGPKFVVTDHTNQAQLFAGDSEEDLKNWLDNYLKVEDGNAAQH